MNVYIVVIIKEKFMNLRGNMGKVEGREGGLGVIYCLCIKFLKK